MHGVTSGLVVLGRIRKKAEQATERKPVSRVHPWLQHRFMPPVLALTFVHDVIGMYMPNKLFLPQAASSHGVRKQSKTHSLFII